MKLRYSAERARAIELMSMKQTVLRLRSLGKIHFHFSTRLDFSEEINREEVSENVLVLNFTKFLARAMGKFLGCCLANIEDNIAPKLINEKMYQVKKPLLSGENAQFFLE